MNNAFKKNIETSWCPGCGNFSILKTLEEVFSERGYAPHEVLIVSGIGQAAKLPHYITTHGINGLHGRALPMALGVKAGNPRLKVVVVSGDGDTYGEGGNHFIHNIRRNLDIVHIVHNNQIYGLTKGQASPTTAMGQITTLQIDGVINSPLNPIVLAIGMDASFVARSFSGDQEHLKQMLHAAFDHKGYSLIDILQPCISFNKVNTFKWYKDRVFKLDESYESENRVLAFEVGLKFGDEGIPLGIIYRKQKRTFMESQGHMSYESKTPEVVQEIFDEL